MCPGGGFQAVTVGALRIQHIVVADLGVLGPWPPILPIASTFELGTDLARPRPHELAQADTTMETLQQAGEQRVALLLRGGLPTSTPSAPVLSAIAEDRAGSQDLTDVEDVCPQWTCTMLVRIAAPGIAIELPYRVPVLPKDTMPTDDAAVTPSPTRQ
jgi:hypothetical protein